MYKSVESVESVDLNSLTLVIIINYVADCQGVNMKTFKCLECNKMYSSSQSLWNHKQKCKPSNPTKDNTGGRGLDFKLSKIADKILNNKGDIEKAIKPSTGTTLIGKLEEYRRNDTKPVKEILPVHETAKLNFDMQPNIESSKDETV